MNEDAWSIAQLADAAGLTRRAIRFYVQQKLIDPPAGLGRGRHYNPHHLAQLRRIHDLQSAGHSLDEIRRLLQGESLPPPQNPRRRPRPLVQAELWTRLRVADGIELTFDARRFSPAATDLAKLRDAIRHTFGVDPSANESDRNEHDHDAD